MQLARIEIRFRLFFCQIGPFLRQNILHQFLIPYVQQKYYKYVNIMEKLYKQDTFEPAHASGIDLTPINQLGTQPSIYFPAIEHDKQPPKTPAITQLLARTAETDDITKQEPASLENHKEQDAFDDATRIDEGECCDARQQKDNLEHIISKDSQQSGPIKARIRVVNFVMRTNLQAAAIVANKIKKEEEMKNLQTYLMLAQEMGEAHVDGILGLLAQCNDLSKEEKAELFLMLKNNIETANISTSNTTV
ncbi:hypothetical protein FGO68_gene9666 [Halteria grandinella]|uniref:Uncharacterized protein n=1 Tax=Halteria grandinella TaxID=5974 RepID=A0A8J8NP99_HALGN|nr:hypothetical protein FGO68_gene9666 [Halteria grandinella]